MMDCHSHESGNPDLLMVLDSASKPTLSKQKLALSVAEWAEWVWNDNPQSTLDKVLV